MALLLLKRWMERPRDRALVAAALVAQTALAIGYVWALLALRDVPESEANLRLSLIYAPFEIISAAIAWVASRSAEGRVRRGWLLIAGAMACSAMVNLDWVWISLDTAHRFSWPIYTIAYAQFPLTLWAFATFPRAGQDDADRETLLLDSAIVLVAGAVLAWHLVFREILTSTGAGVLITARALSYTVLCLTVFFSAVALFVRRPTRRMLIPLGYLIAAWAVWTLANTLQMRAMVTKSPLSDVTFNTFFAAAAWLVTVAATIFRLQAPSASSAASVDDPSGTSEPAPSHSLLPYAAIAGVYGVLLLQTRHAAATATRETTAPLTALVMGAIVITLLVVYRQVIAQRRNAALVAERLNRESHFRALVQHASDVIMVIDADGIVREASPSVAHTLGHSVESLIGTPLVEIVAPSDRLLAAADLAQIAAAPSSMNRLQPSAASEWRVLREGGATRWLEVLCTNLLEDPAVRGIVLNARDVSERKALEAELTHQAYHDSLTGLLNRSRFRNIVEETLERRQQGEPGERAALALLYLDLDEFKPVNDSLGHEAGDRVLAIVTERLRDATRGSDVVARLGGDEFAVLLEHVRDVEEATEVARRVLERVQQPIYLGSATVCVGVSVGIACTDSGRVPRHEGAVERAATCEALLRDADEAMYLAKTQGGRRHVVFAPRVAGGANADA